MRKNKKIRSFAVTKYFILWIVLFIVAIVFTQALPNSVTAVLLAVVAVLPVTELIYLIIGKLSIKASFGCSAEKTEKQSDLKYILNINSVFPIPFPFVEAEFILPDEDTAALKPYNFRIPLLPLGKYKINRTTKFYYRGNYVFGIKSIFFSDLLRFYRIRISSDQLARVFVMPRRIELDFDHENGISDNSSSAALTNSGYDRSEPSDIKEYKPGDPMKTVHWKLSGKTQTLMVKRFGADLGNKVCVFADLCRRFDIGEDSGNRDDINEFCADAIVETACACVTDIISSGEKVRLVFNDGRENVSEENRISRSDLESAAEFESFFEYFGASPLAEPSDDISKLPSEDECGADNSFIFILSYLSAETVAGICSAAADAKKTTVLICEPFEKMKRRKEAAADYERYMNTLNSCGIDVFTPSAKQHVK